MSGRTVQGAGRAEQGELSLFRVEESPFWEQGVFSWHVRKAQLGNGEHRACFRSGESCAGMQGRPALGLRRACPVLLGFRGLFQWLLWACLGVSVLFLNPVPSSQLTINTAIVYMHRFYMVQSFTQFHRNVSAGIWGV